MTGGMGYTVPVTLVDGALGRTEQELTSAMDAALYVADGTLADGPIGQVGLELEAHCFDWVDPAQRPSWDCIAEVIACLPALPGGSRVTVEPGGAVELSGPPATGVLGAVTAMQMDRAVVREHFARAGLGLLLLGADPLRAPRRIHPGGRYQAMERFFERSGTGAMGAAMMTATASIQVNIDAGPRDGWTERVRLAHALGPTMVAITANSPLLAGEFTGWQSSRQQVWSELDSARCGPVLGVSGLDPATDWAQYALKAPVMLVHDPEPRPVLEWVPFVEWVQGGVLLGGRRPTTEDLDYHLTTLFPPVRPRRWIEIRYLDVVSDVLWPAVVFTLVTLLDRAPDAAAAAVEDVAAAWDTAARIGLRDRHLFEAATRCLAIAEPFVPAALADSFDRLSASVRGGRCPGEEFAENAVAKGIEPAVLEALG